MAQLTFTPEETSALLSSWDADGFVALPSYFPPDVVSSLNAALDDVIRDTVPRMPPEHKFYEDVTRPETLKQLQSLHTYHPVFASLADPATSPLAAIASLVLGGQGVSCQNMQFFNKPPGVGASAPTVPHQDGAYFLLSPPGCAVTFWVALEAVDEETGCVRYRRGSHRRGLLPHAPSGVLGFSRTLEGPMPVEDEEVALPATPGTVLAHHPLAIHRADGNASPVRSRKAIGVIFYGETAKEDVEGKAAYQARLREALLREGKIVA
jgi:phytanoyl-CoA hydroxylase